MYSDLYNMTIEELYKTLDNRRKGLAYSLWKQAELNRYVLDPKNFPNTPEEASPELYPPKKTYKKFSFLEGKEKEIKH